METAECLKIPIQMMSQKKKKRDYYTMELDVPQVNFGSSILPPIENLTTCILDIPEVVLHCGFCRWHYIGLYILYFYCSLRKYKLGD